MAAISVSIDRLLEECEFVRGCSASTAKDAANVGSIDMESYQIHERRNFVEMVRRYFDRVGGMMCVRLPSSGIAEGVVDGPAMQITIFGMEFLCRSEFICVYPLKLVTLSRILTLD